MRRTRMILRLAMYAAILRRAWALRSWRKAREERRRFDAMFDATLKRILTLSED